MNPSVRPFFETTLATYLHVNRFAPVGYTRVTIYLFEMCIIPLNVASPCVLGFQGFALMHETLRVPEIIYWYLSRCMPRSRFTLGYFP